MKKLIFAFTLLILLIEGSKAQVVVTQGTFPVMCQGGPFVTQINPIIIAETGLADFVPSCGPFCYYTYFMPIPIGYEMSGTMAVTKNLGDIVSVNSYPSIVSGQYGVTISYLCYSSSSKDTLKISGLRIRALNAAPTTANMTRGGCLCMNEAAQTGNSIVNGNIHAVLNSTAPPSTVTISTSSLNYCANDNTLYPITVTPSGGTITGTRVVGGSDYQPSSVAVPSFPGVNDYLQYDYNFFGCTFTANTTVFVAAVPNVSFTDNDADNNLCPSQSITFTASATGSNKRYQFLKNGIATTTLSSTNTFTTNSIINGDKISVLADNGNLTCSNTSSQVTYNVIPNPASIAVNGLPSLLCSNTSGIFSISTSPVGGVLSGSGLSGSNFSPSIAGAGSHIITYTVTASGCVFPISTSAIDVVSAPTITLTSSDANNIICAGDLVTFTANTTGAVSRYQFFINGSGPLLNINSLSSSALTDASITSVTVDDGANTCATASNIITTTVGKYPKSNFTWKNVCGLNDVTFHDVSTIPVGNSIVSWGWDFTNNGSIDLTQITSLPDPSNTYPITNTYQTRLRTTSDKGCINDTIIRIYTLPGKTPTSSDPYAINFTSSNQGWAYDGTNSSWGWGTAPSDFGAGSRNVWSTGQNSPDGKYKTNEHSYLYGPCINFSQLDKPMLAIKLSSKIIDKPAGAILEVTSDEGLNWVKLGNLEEGINWYNVAGIVATPFTYLANSTNNNPLAQGWSTSSVNFDNNNLSKIGLQSYSGKTSVRFRINFASVADINATRFAGIGIDSFWIGNRNKIALIEHLTNKSGARACCLAPDNAIDFIIDKRKSDVVSINYHTSFPTGDAINLVYPNAGSSRVLFYGNSSPKTILNGIKYNGAIYSGGTAVTRLDTADVDAVVLENAIFKIDLTTIITANNVTAKVKINYIDNKTIAKDIILHFVVVEDTANGNPIYNNSCRQMLPDPAGNFYFGPNFINSIWQWTPGSFIYSSQSWNHSLPANAKLKVIVFIQDAYTKEVYQATYVKGSGTYGNVVVLSNSDEVNNQQYIDIYPNPSSDQVNVVFEGLLKNEVYWQLLDNMGKLIKDGKINEGIINYEIDTHEISNGLYNIKFTNGNIIQNKKIIITKYKTF